MNKDVYIDLGDGTQWYPGREGHEFYPEMIAAALSKLCRFTGHVRKFYSVAEHSVKVSYMVPEEFAMEGLMHDAHEALINDLSTPIKTFMGDAYTALADKADKDVRTSFMLMAVEPPEVKLADVYSCLIEADELMVGRGKGWKEYAHVREIALDASRTNPYLRPQCWDPERGYQEFMRRFTDLSRR